MVDECLSRGGIGLGSTSSDSRYLAVGCGWLEMPDVCFPKGVSMKPKNSNVEWTWKWIEKWLRKRAREPKFMKVIAKQDIGWPRLLVKWQVQRLMDLAGQRHSAILSTFRLLPSGQLSSSHLALDF